jgi:hypothetical protein
MLLEKYRVLRLTADAPSIGTVSHGAHCYGVEKNWDIHDICCLLAKKSGMALDEENLSKRARTFGL